MMYKTNIPSHYTLVITKKIQDWADTPTSTSVAQIPIESVVYPAVTLCAIDVDEEPSLEHMLRECSFTKNNQDSGEVCLRVQVSCHNLVTVLSYLPFI